MSQYAPYIQTARSGMFHSQPQCASTLHTVKLYAPVCSTVTSTRQYAPYSQTARSGVFHSQPQRASTLHTVKPYAPVSKEPALHQVRRRSISQTLLLKSSTSHYGKFNVFTKTSLPHLSDGMTE